MKIRFALQSRDTILFGDPYPNPEHKKWVLYMNIPVVDYEVSSHTESEHRMPLFLIIDAILRKNLKLLVSLGRKNEYAFFKLSSLVKRLNISQKEAKSLLSKVKLCGGKNVSVIQIDKELYERFHKAFVLNRFEAVRDRGSALQKGISFDIMDGDYPIIRGGQQAFGEWNPLELGAKEDYEFLVTIVKDEDDPTIKVDKRTLYPFEKSGVAIISNRSDTSQNGWHILVLA